MFESVAKNQHYVWKHYLQAWTINDQLICHRQRDRKTITTNPKNIGSSRYFYGLETFTDLELEYLKALPNRSKSELGRQVALNFVNFFTMSTQLRRLIDSLPPRDEETRAKSEELLLNVERGLGEAWHVSVEHKGAPFLDRLRAGDASFWADEREASDFCFFLGTQFTRTARMSKAISAIELPMGLDLARLWPVESHLWATDVGAGLIGHRMTTHGTILTNDTSTPFITADQPVINLRPQADPVSVFYYPITPTIALHLEIGQADCQVKTRAISQFEAERLNHDMYRWSDDQLYGVDGAYLEAVASLPKAEVL